MDKSENRFICFMPLKTMRKAADDAAEMLLKRILNCHFKKCRG